MTGYYITTPIYYVNGTPHLGHLYTTMIADALRLSRAQRGDDVFLLTGTDEHGRNVERAAAKTKLPIQQYVDGIAEQFKHVITDFGLEVSRFVRTTSEPHKKGARQLFEALQASHNIYKGHYDGLYCVGCNQYYTETEAEVAEDQRFCPTHRTPLEHVREESYFFKLSNFQTRLLEHYEKHPNFIRPEARLREVVSFVSSGLTDLSVSRTAVRWGIEVPNDPKHTLYVWLDALSNYITALGYGNEEFHEFERFWPADVHLVGKDILRFHAVYWPAFLMAAGLPLPKQIAAHGMWISGGRKMSKSLGNIINIEALRRHFTLDAIRYFSLREKSFGEDADFNYPALLRRFNSDLANGLGNLASRTFTLVKKHLGGQVPAVDPNDADPAIKAVRVVLEECLAQYEQEFERFEFNRALQTAWRIIAETDSYLATKEPWKFAKAPNQTGELETVLGTSTEVLRFLAVLLYPAQPIAMASLWTQLGLEGTPATVNPMQLKWGEAAARPLGPLTTLYPRYDEAKVLAQLESESEYRPDLNVEVSPRGDEASSRSGAPAQYQSHAAPTSKKKRTAHSGPTPTSRGGGAPEMIAFEDFSKLDLRTGVVRSAQKVPNADRLLHLEVDTGEKQPLTIVSGIAASIAPETLPGARVVVLVNLKPRKLRGIMSEGMLLTATLPDGALRLVTTSEGVPAGCRVS